MTVEPVHQTNIIDLKIIANSPTQANADLQRVIDAYFEERSGTAQDSGATVFFDAQLKMKGQQLDQDQAALTAFEQQHGIADLDDQTRLQVERIAHLQDQLATAQAGLTPQQEKATAQHAALQATPARTETLQRTITNQYSQERLNTSLVELENRKIELTKRYQPDDRQIIEISEKIATVREAIAAAAQLPAKETATDANPVWQQLSLAVATSTSEVGGYSGEIRTLRNEIGEAQRRLNDLEQAAAPFGGLRRKVQQSLADYTLYAQRRDEARISEALDRERLFNVAVLQRPMASSEQLRPKPLLYLTVSAIFALLFSMVLSLYTDTSGGEVHNPGQLEAITGTRTLATVADETEGERLETANRLQYRRVLFSVRQAVHNIRSGMEGAGQVPLGAHQEPDLEPLGVCVAFISALQGEGVSFLANHLAMEVAQQASSRVAVLHMPTLLHQFEADGDLRIATRFDQDTSHWVLAPGPRNDAVAVPELLGAHGHFPSRLRPILAQARREFDLLVLDCPSLQASTLASEIAPCIDGYVAVVRADMARKQNIEDLISQLTSTSTPVLGFVLNGRRYPVPNWLYRILW